MSSEKVAKIKIHAADEMVGDGRVRWKDEDGNEVGGTAADLGRRRQPEHILDKNLRACAGDSADGILVQMYMDSSISPVLDQRRTLKLVIVAIHGIRAAGFSIARGLELSGWNRVLIAGTVALLFTLLLKLPAGNILLIGLLTFWPCLILSDTKGCN